MQKIDVLAQNNTPGVLLADGGVLLQRRGTTNTFTAIVNGVYVSASVFGHNVRAEVSYEDGRNGPRHSRAAEYHRTNPASVEPFPARFITETLNFIELHSGKRPSGISQQTAAYMYSGQTDLSRTSDVIPSPFRYDSKEAVIQYVEGDAVIARSKNARDASAQPQFDPKLVEVEECDDRIKDALRKALSIGFHLCDTKYGSDYCLRRLAWLAGVFFEASNAGAILPMYVLSTDMETAVDLNPVLPMPPTAT
jgi:hypothetical protein